jgi:hypothetical protein
VLSFSVVCCLFSCVLSFSVVCCLSSRVLSFLRESHPPAQSPPPPPLFAREGSREGCWSALPSTPHTPNKLPALQHPPTCLEYTGSVLRGVSGQGFSWNLGEVLRRSPSGAVKQQQQKERQRNALLMQGGSSKTEREERLGSRRGKVPQDQALQQQL